MKLYRPNVAAIMMRSDGRILVCERETPAGAWQFPQGGIDPGESAMEALYREVCEEIGFEACDYAVEKVSDSPYRYDYPDFVLQKKLLKRPEFIGQEQTYFLCKLHTDKDPSLDQEHREFSQFQWIFPSEFQLNWLPDFKKTVYQQVFLDFFNLQLS